PGGPSTDQIGAHWAKPVRSSLARISEARHGHGRHDVRSTPEVAACRPEPGPQSAGASLPPPGSGLSARLPHVSAWARRVARLYGYPDRTRRRLHRPRELRAAVG